MNVTPRIGIAMGDPAGISAELLAKLLVRTDLIALAAVTVFGDRRVLAQGEKAAGVTLDLPVTNSIGSGGGRPTDISRPEKS